MLEIIASFFEMVGSIVEGLIHFISYIPKLFRMITAGNQIMLTMFNELPAWLFVIGSVTLAGAVIWIVVEII